MQTNPISEIKRFQEDRNLHMQQYEWDNEATNIIEELLEAQGLNVSKQKRVQLRAKVNSFVVGTWDDLLLAKKATKEEDIVDAYADIIVFSIGAIMKLGYDPECVLLEVAKEINSRKGRIVDGKFQKLQPGDDGYEKPYKANYKGCKT